MTLKLQHPFTIIVAGPSYSGKSTFVTKFIKCRNKVCDIKFKNIVWCHGEDSAPRRLKKVSFFEGVPEFTNPDNIPTLFVLDDLMNEAYSKRVSELFTKGSHHRNISVILITQNLFHQAKDSRDISLNSKYITVFKNPRDKTQIVHLGRQVYPENSPSFHKAYLDATKDPHSYLFLDLTQNINNLLRFRTKIFPGEITVVYAPVNGNEPIEIPVTLPTRPEGLETSSQTSVTSKRKRRADKDNNRVRNKRTKR
jgi:hypothetical protein